MNVQVSDHPYADNTVLLNKSYKKMQSLPADRVSFNALKANMPGVPPTVTWSS